MQRKGQRSYSFLHPCTKLKIRSFLLLSPPSATSLQNHEHKPSSLLKIIVHIIHPSSPIITQIQNAQQRPHTRSPRAGFQPEARETEPAPHDAVLRPPGPRKPHNPRLQDDLRYLLRPSFYCGPHHLHPLAQPPAPQAQVPHPGVQLAGPDPKLRVRKRRHNVQSIRAKLQPEHRGLLRVHGRRRLLPGPENRVQAVTLPVLSAAQEHDGGGRRS